MNELFKMAEDYKSNNAKANNNESDQAQKQKILDSFSEQFNTRFSKFISALDEVNVKYKIKYEDENVSARPIVEFSKIPVKKTVKIYLLRSLGQQGYTMQWREKESQRTHNSVEPPIEKLANVILNHLVKPAEIMRETGIEN